ncbi:Glycoprotein gp2 [Hyphomicrobium sulfonivorans]|uniref:Glycoprotein gp2 n=1 Tax=Hyphomicrobium sulfonivorans TaxID=121290 RepID=A0A109BE64_HYPSL|nr:Glycoprotein gp2 [Hyphomicrobium sulfonivorans]
MTIATVSAITPVGTIHTIMPITAIVPTTVVAVLAVIAIPETVVTLAAVVARAIHTGLIVVTGLLLVLALVHRREIIVALVVTIVIAFNVIEGTLPGDAAIEVTATLADLLLADRHDDAIVVLCVLQIILGQNGIAGGRRIARQ